MLTKLLAAFLLMAACVVIHAIGVTTALRWTRDHAIATAKPRFWERMWLFVRVAAWIVLFHLVEIGVWATFYWWKAAMPDLQSALYFSAVTYTTTGYGDLVLPESMAAGRRRRGPDGHPDVRLVHRLLLRGGEPHRRGTLEHDANLTP